VRFLAVLGKNGPFRHWFGHDEGVTGLVPQGQTEPAQLVLTLDTADPRIAGLVPIDVSLIRIVHPYVYSEGGTFVYRHTLEGGIEFLRPQLPEWDRLASPPDGDWPSVDFPKELPGMPSELVEDRGQTDSWNVDRILVGDDQATIQGYDGILCVACGAGGLRLIAGVPSRPLPSLLLWGEHGDGVMAVFWYCNSCQAINTHNECD